MPGGVDLQTIIDELARVVSDPEHAAVLVTRAGFPAQLLPRFTTSLSFWSTVIHAAEDGAVNGGAPRLVLEAARLYPANRVLAKVRGDAADSVEGPVAPSFGGGEGAPPVPPVVEPEPPPPDSRANEQISSRSYFIVGLIALAIVFLLIFRPPGIPYSLHVAFEDADDPSSGIDGRFVIVLGSEEHQCVLENHLSCRIPDIPERFVGTTMTTRLDGSAHRIIKGPYAIERDGNVTIFVQKRRQLFELRATFVRGKVIEFAPEPKMLSVKPTLRLSSGSSSPISVGHYDIAVLGKDGNTVMKQHYVHDSPSSVEPGNVLDVTLDLLIPRSAVEGRRANGTLRVTVLDGGASDSGPVVVHAEVDVSLDDPDLDWLSDGSSGTTANHGGDTDETGTDLQPCPMGSLLVSVEGADPTCIETTPREPIDRRSASNVCKSSGWDLCRSSVYKRACTQYGDVQLEQNAVEFTFDSPGLTYEGCVNVGRSPSPERAQYRCCIGPTSSAVPSPAPRLSVPSGVRCDEWVVHNNALVCKVCRASLSLSSHIQDAIGSVSCGPMKPGIIDASIENTITGDSFYENDPGNNEMAGRYEYEFWLGKRSDGEQCDGSRCFRSCNAPAKDAEGCVFDKIVKTQPDALVPRVREKLQGKEATLSVKNTVCSPRKSPDRCFIRGDVVFTWVSNR